jgi:hypothetical protein
MTDGPETTSSSAEETPTTQEPAEPVAAETTPHVGAPADPVPTEAAPASPPTAPVPQLQKSLDERKAALDTALAGFGAEEWRTENRSEFQATIVKGKRIHHVLHLILTIVTLGTWAIVWILLAIFRGEKRQLVTVDDFGNVVATSI